MLSNILIVFRLNGHLAIRSCVTNWCCSLPLPGDDELALLTRLPVTRKRTVIDVSAGLIRGYGKNYFCCLAFTADFGRLDAKVGEIEVVGHAIADDQNGPNDCARLHDQCWVDQPIDIAAHTFIEHFAITIDGPQRKFDLDQWCCLLA